MIKAYGSPHYLFYCRDCEAPILLRAETLAQPSGPQVFRSTAFLSLAVVCPHCKRVRSYSLDKASPNYDPMGKLVAPDKTSNAMSAGWLRCDEENCQTPLPLFSLASVPIDDEARRALLATWIWGDVKCPSGHPVPKPEKLKF